MTTSAWHILLVDDDEDDYILTRHMLAETHGVRCSITWAPDYDAGKVALQEGCYDAALIDYDLGSSNGLDLIREVTKHKCSLPIILLTGRGSYEVDVEAMSAGASLYLTKNEVNPLLLERSIRFAIERKQAEEALARAHRELELRVQERTQELADSNQALNQAKNELEERVAERTLELFLANSHLTKELNERARAENELLHLQWLLTKSIQGEAETDTQGEQAQVYGNLADLNTARLILDSVGEEVLREVVGDFLELLDTSAAVYEANGDYAFGMFTSGWCRQLDAASFQLAGTTNPRAALDSGKWLCHDSCWHKASKPTIETGQVNDIECNGGLRIFAAPIVANGRVVGVINFGYGNPPKELDRLEQIARDYQIPVETLSALADAYEARPPYFIDLARKRLQLSARLLGLLVERKLLIDALQQGENQPKPSNTIRPEDSSNHEAQLHR